MSTTVRRSTHLSRHLQSLREQRCLRPGQLAVALGASNPSKVGSLIRSFELGDHLSDHWLQALVEELQPEPTPDPETTDEVSSVPSTQAEVETQVITSPSATESGLATFIESAGDGSNTVTATIPPWRFNYIRRPY